MAGSGGKPKQQHAQEAINCPLPSDRLTIDLLQLYTPGPHPQCLATVRPEPSKKEKTDCVDVYDVNRVEAMLVHDVEWDNYNQRWDGTWEDNPRVKVDCFEVKIDGDDVLVREREL